MTQNQRPLEFAENILLECFQHDKPAVLFLGQEAFAPDAGGHDPMLIALAEEVGYNEAENRGWSGLLDNRRLRDDHLRWLTERFERNALSEATSAILDMPWSAFFTTSIDPTIRKRIEAHGREPELIVCADWFPLLARSRARPPVTHLFGLSNGSTSHELAPRDNLELRRRQNSQALPLARRMAEAATMLGLIVIDGFSPGRDWLDPNDFFSVFPVGSTPNIIWFGVTVDCIPTVAADLASRGVLITEQRRLRDVLLSLQADGRLDLSSLPAPSELGVLHLVGERTVVIDPGLRLRVEASAAIVEDDWCIMPPDSLSCESDMFERFHGDLSSRRGLVEGIARGFAIEREFEATLRKRVNMALNRQDDLNRIVLLHGQSATGKSIAIARLALILRRDDRLPVLYARNRMPQVQDILTFAELAEANGAPATVILADCNQRPERYLDFASGLRAMGRRIVVVGTAYLQTTKGMSDFVEAPASLTPNERAKLQQLLDANGCSEVSSALADSSHQNTLAWIYRYISSSRETIISGVAREARAAEELIRKRMQTERYTPRRSQLAEQLIEAGCHNGNLPMFEFAGELDKFGGDAAGRLIDLVMAPGRLGASVPLNLLLRVLGASYRLELVEIARLFEDLDIFRWHYADEQQSELTVSPRIRLEADLICRRRLLDTHTEMNRLLDLIRGILPTGLEHRIELDFLRDLLQRLDADGPRGNVYAPWFLDIAQALTDLRIRNRIMDANLMLQESAFRRAALRFNNSDSPNYTNLDVTARASILNDARAIVEEALSAIDTGQLHASPHIKDNLQTERASIYGFLAVGRVRGQDSQDSNEDVWSDYLAARVASRAAMGTVDDYFPLDIALWISTDVLLETNATNFPLNDVRRAELVADIHEILDGVEVNILSPEQKQRFHRQQAKAARALNDNPMADEALARLEELNPAAGIYLRVRTYAEDAALMGTSADINEAARKQAETLATYLDERLSTVGDDSRCLNLLLILKWIAATGRRPMRGMRQPIPYEVATRSDISSIVDRLVESAGTNARFALRHLQATIHWVAGDIRHAEELWRSLSRDTEAEDRTRTTRRYFFAESSGLPRWFSGRVTQQRNRGYWRLAVEGLQGGVVLLDEHDFRDQDIAVGREVRGFAIAFNYIGPMADPPNRYRDMR